MAAEITSKTFTDPRDVLVKPVISEKSYSLLDENKYTFVVSPGANKTQIKQAVEAVFSVKVKSVNTLNRRGKRKRSMTGFGKRKDTKRAIVTLAEGSRIDIFGGPPASAKTVPTVSALEEPPKDLTVDSFAVLQALPAVPREHSWGSKESQARFIELTQLEPDREQLFYWTIRVSEEAHRWAETQQIDPAHEYIAVGYLGPEYDQLQRGEFGVILYQEAGGRNKGSGQVIGSLDVDGERFTIVRRVVRYRQSMTVDPPPGGTVASWARSRDGRDEGWLTARHAVTLNGPVHFSEGGADRGSGYVKRYGAGEIDAALVSTDTPPDPPPKARRTVVSAPRILFKKVTFVAASGNTIESTVVDIPLQFPMLMDPKYPVRLSLSRAGTFGDSGALICIAGSGDAAGIYIEDWRSEARWGLPASSGGVGLAAEQIEAILEIELRK